MFLKHWVLISGSSDFWFEENHEKARKEEYSFENSPRPSLQREGDFLRINTYG